MIDLLLKITPILISLISLMISIIVAWSNRKSLQVEIHKPCEFAEGGTIFFLDDEGPTPYGDSIWTKIEVVNPSPKDIAFFDLRAFYPSNNTNVDLLTRRTVSETYRSKSLYRAIQFPDNKVQLTELNIPDANYGVFKANSFTRFDIVMFPDPEASELLLSFKVAMKAKIRDKFAVTGRKKFKFYGMAYQISSWTEPSQSQQ
ncbi:hypothetical protein [Heyndrickxia faecalis]|uniref:hypothetical protein n=1 Tax=Heyndrickxia faecalis TaxID=2824910 RepID=UPI003D1FD6F1